MSIFKRFAEDFLGAPPAYGRNVVATGRFCENCGAPTVAKRYTKYDKDTGARVEMLDDHELCTRTRYCGCHGLPGL